MRLLIVFVLVQVSVIHAGTVALQVDALRQLCRLKGGGPQVTSISEVRALIDLLRSGSGIECPSETKTAILALEPVIELQDVCSEKAADIIVKFWKDYAKKRSKVRKHLPEQLRQFFIAYGVQVNKLCKRTMMDELEKVSREAGITDADIKTVAEPVLQKVDKIFGEETKVDFLLVIISTDRADDLDESRKKVISLNPKQKRYMDLVRERCVKKFKPIYDTLIAPVVRLASIGLSYDGDSIREDQFAFERSSLFKSWFAAVLVCEATSRYNSIEIPKEIEDEEGNTQLVTFLDDDDLQELQTRTGLSVEAIREPQIEEPTDYKTKAVQVADLVVDDADKHLLNIMSNYGRAMKGLDQLRWRMIKRLPAMLKMYAKEKMVKFGLLPRETKRNGVKRTKFGSYAGRVVRFLAWIMVGAVITGAIAYGLFIAAAVTFGFASFLIFFLDIVIVLILTSYFLTRAFDIPVFDDFKNIN